MPPICEVTRGLISLEGALERLKAELLTAPRSEKIPLDALIGRRCSGAVISPMDFPPFSNAAMDGYALRSEDALPGARLTLTGVIPAGSVAACDLAPGECARILTGARMPLGADTVVVQEKVRKEEGAIVLLISEPLPMGANVRLRGEEIQRGDPLLSQGRRIGPYEAGVLAYAGFSELEVLPRLRVGVLATGSELVLPGQRLETGQIYESNRPVLLGLLQECGQIGIDLGFVGDDLERLKEQIRLASPGLDALVTTGGASEGDADHMANLLKEEGEVAFWKVAIKPGKPFMFGRYDGMPVFGLPGNPVSAVTTFLKLVQPGLRFLSGDVSDQRSRLFFPLAEPIRRQPGRTEFLRAELISGAFGPEVLALRQQGSHRLTSLSEADCLIRLAPEISSLSKGECVEVEFLPGAARIPGEGRG